MLLKLAWRGLTGLSPRIQWNVAYKYAFKGMLAVRQYKAALKRGELFPPFMFVALTNTCNLRCHGCWVEKEGRADFMPVDDLSKMISEGKKKGTYYWTLLGGEPFMHKGIWEIFRRHKDCYFQVITNGMFFTEKNVQRRVRRGGGRAGPAEAG
jgi:MoaA/NifB/PqqE/SkfB family radical SAM enzyme